MSLIFILDDSPLPARYGVTASHWANQHRLPLWSLRPDFCGDVPDSHQHVARAGYCVTSGLYRSDTLQQEVSTVSALPTADAVIVLPATRAADIADLPGTRLYSHDGGQALTLRDNAPPLLTLHADHYGRWSATPTVETPPGLRIGLIGREADHRQAYPATLAALGDAAAALHLTLDIRFLPPATLSIDLHELDGLHGVLLPGGSSMAAVQGQIRVAQATRTRALPSLGLCLGMQSMSTAAVRQQPGYAGAILAEVAPDAALHSFVAFADHRHRCGVLPFADGEMHYNHRYRFNPALLPQLKASGVQVNAHTDDIVEAITLPDHPFWQGVQGHPELASRPDAPHPLITAFLLAALSQRG
ncbi:MAG: CTP synthase [Pantoea sp.]|uniref:glutamine amidotransferase-related protein n=1 Tax=Pantoea sp. TaxID=69393 RepID=UPI0039E5C838